MEDKIKSIQECETLFEYRKQFSRWHFIPDKDKQEQVVRNFCKFRGDWDNELRSLNDVPLPGEIDDYRKKLIAEATIFGNSHDNYYKIQSFDPKKHKKLNDIVNKIGLDAVRVRIHCQKPGQMASWHLDKAQIPNEHRDPKKTHRLYVFLQDWNFGQVIEIGNTIITHWKKGDTVWYNWRDLPHGTANFGHDDRFIMIITGTETPQFLELLKNYQIFNI